MNFPLPPSYNKWRRGKPIQLISETHIPSLVDVAFWQLHIIKVYLWSGHSLNCNTNVWQVPGQRKCFGYATGSFLVHNFTLLKICAILMELHGYMMTIEYMMQFHRYTMYNYDKKAVYLTPCYSYNIAMSCFSQYKVQQQNAISWTCMKINLRN